MNDIDVSPTSLDEVQEMTDELKNNRASGVDEISAEILKWGGEGVIEWLHQIILATWHT